MKRIILAWAAILLALVALLTLYAFTPAPAFADRPMAGPVVKVLPEKGHGSGVAIGGGYVVTAAHVVKDALTVKLKGDDGQVTRAEVLWQNKARDIALLKADRDIFTASRLSCDSAEVGALIHAKGNPLNMEFVTMWGRIAGISRKVGPWKEAYVTDMTILPGMSGGAVYNSRGEIVGISIGVANSVNGFSISMTGMTFVVPSYQICSMLGR